MSRNARSYRLLRYLVGPPRAPPGPKRESPARRRGSHMGITLGPVTEAVLVNAVIVDAVRTPVARRNGKFKDIHAVDLASIPLRALIDRTGIDPGLIEDVI